MLLQFYFQATGNGEAQFIISDYDFVDLRAPVQFHYVDIIYRHLLYYDNLCSFVGSFPCFTDSGCIL